MSSEFNFDAPIPPVESPPVEQDDLATFQFETVPIKPPVARWRHAIALLFLLGFISLIFLVSFFAGDAAKANGPALPSTSVALVVQTFVELLLFSAFWGVAWLFSRASTDDLFLRWRGTWQTWVLGLAYSIGLRFVIIGVAMVAIIGALISGFKPEEITQFAKSFSPTPERMVSTKALANDPIYRLLMVTWVSFIVAGLREELWRVGVIAACTKLLTPRFSTRGAQIFAVVMSSLFFGMAHYIQGLLAVGMTAVIGMCLGAITLINRSVWPAIIAHGAFDALSFLMLPLANQIKPPQL